MVHAEFDIIKLARSIIKAGKAFGDTNRGAVARWGVQTCRELAVSTQAYGKSGTKKKQQFAIEADARRVIWPVDSVKPSRTGRTVRYSFEGKSGNWAQSRFLKDEAAVNDWIEMNRTRRRARTAKLPFSELAICTIDVFNKAMKGRFARAGMAKGGWLGAGADIAKRQTGTDRINIGKNFLGYAQKHSAKGSATATANPFRPIASLKNGAKHSGSSYVLSEKEKRKAILFGARKTLSWYKHATKRKLDSA